jgi:acyl-CoA synthetase (NDP forming)
LAVSHSGALAGSDRCYQAVFDYYGVQRVSDMDELATALVMFAQPHEAASGGLVCLHDSGGERQLIIDLADGLKVPLTEVEESTSARLSEMLDPGLPAVNPLDAWGAGGPNASATMASCFSILLTDPGAAMGAVVHDRGPNSEIYSSYLDYLEKAQRASGKPVFLVANRQGSGADELAISSTYQGLPVIDGVSQFLVGARCLLAYRDFQQRAVMKCDVTDQQKVDYWKRQLQDCDYVSESLASELLRDFGIPMIQSLEVSSLDELQTAVLNVGFPLVLKTAVQGIDHKTEVGGVILNISDQPQLQDAYEDLLQRLGPAVTVAPMADNNGVEMILGVSRDEQFGPTVVVGFGGIYAEILSDVAVMLPPFDSAEVKRVLKSLSMYPLLEGVRGGSPLDIDSYCDVAAKMSAIALALSDSVVEIDINPVRLGVKGCIGLDALVVQEQKN